VAEFGKDPFEEAENGLIEGDVDDLAAARLISPAKRRERPDGGVEGRYGVPDADPHLERRSVGKAGDEAKAAQRLARAPVAGAVAVGAGLAEARDADQDQLRVCLPELRWPQVPRLQAHRPEVLDDDVDFRGKTADELLPGRFAEIDRDRLLVPGLDHRPEGPLLGDDAPGPQRIAHAWRLDLEDAGAHVGQQPRAEGTRDEGPELENPHSIELATSLVTHLSTVPSGGSQHPLHGTA